MSVQKIDNFDYRGQKPNFARDVVATLADLLGANANHYPDGHIVYCQETDLHYKFNSSNEMDEHTGRFRLFQTGGGDLSDYYTKDDTDQLISGKADSSTVSGMQSKLDLLYDREFPITASLRVDDITSEAETINSGKVYSRDSTIALLGVYSSLKQAGIEIEEGEITDLIIIQQDGAGQTIREKEFLDISEGKSFEEWENVGVPAGSNAQGALKTIATFNMANGKSYSANHTMYFACPVYFAVVGKDFEVSQENIVNLVAQSTTQKFLQATKGKTVTFSQNDEKNCYIVPKDYGALTSISDGQDNFLNTSYELTEGIILTAADGSEHEYRVYMMKDASSVSNYKLTFG